MSIRWGTCCDSASDPAGYRSILSPFAQERLAAIEEAKAKGQPHPFKKEWDAEFAHKGDGARLKSYEVPA